MTLIQLAMKFSIVLFVVRMNRKRVPGRMWFFVELNKYHLYLQINYSIYNTDLLKIKIFCIICTSQHMKH